MKSTHLLKLAVILPTLAIALTTISPTSLPLNFTAITFLLCVWIYRSFTATAHPNSESSYLDAITEKQLKSCFPSVIYHLQDLEYRPQEIYCRGSLRSPNSKYAYETINQNIQKIFGDRFICYLQESPLENSGTSFGNSQENTTNYSFYLRPNHGIKIHPKLGDRQIWIASAISMIFTSITVLVVGANINQTEELSLFNWQRGLPYLLAIATIFITQAIAQFYVTNKYKLKFRPPILLPSLGGFGCLGSFNQHLTTPTAPANQRRILFDLAAIPTIAGLIISMILLMLGNWVLIPATSTINDPAIALMPNLNNFDYKISILMNLWQGLWQATPPVSTSEITANTISTFSPLTLAGWTGLALSALQLMPFDFLAGGSLVIAMFGHRQAVQIARMTRLVLLAIALLIQPWLRIYSLLLFLLPTPTPIILNEHIEICKTRDLVGMILMAIALLIILPVPKLHL